MTPVARALAACAAAILVAPVATRPASATPVAPTRWVVVEGDAPLFDLRDLAPGGRGSARITVTNPADDPMHVRFAVTGLDDGDNGCTEPEAAAGDTTCGADGGELQHDLRLAVLTADVAGTPATTPLHIATVARWAERSVRDPDPLAPGATRRYELAYELPTAAGNVVQSDVVAFAVAVSLAPDSAAAEATHLVVVPATSPLVGTGWPTGLSLAVAGVLVAAGLLLLVVAGAVRPRRASVGPEGPGPDCEGASSCAVRRL
jgi:hypothetical protein